MNMNFQEFTSPTKYSVTEFSDGTSYYFFNESILTILDYDDKEIIVREKYNGWFAFMELWNINIWAILASILVVCTAGGNILVCMAIYLERRLQNVTNYFLMSLAITDCMVAVLVMPLGILSLVKGHFPLPAVYCLLWICLDVLLCTASIMHLCTISIDRYLSLRYPMKFGRNKTRKRVTVKIAFVWISSTAMSLPLSLMYSQDVESLLVDGVCQIPDPLYKSIGSIVSFYIPLVVMMITYALTVQLLARQRKGLGAGWASNWLGAPPIERRCTWRRFLGNRSTPQHSAASTDTELPPIDTRDLWIQDSRMALFFIMNEERRARRIQRTRLRNLANPFELPEQEFFHNYRMNKPMALYLCRELEGELAPRQRHGLPVHIKVLVAIKFMAGGSYQREIGQDHNLCVAQRTASKYLGQVVAAMNRSLKPKWITFPGTERERQDVAAPFQRKYGLPHLLGTLDCTHVAIFPPLRPHGLQYINRKGKHTINVQLITDVNCRLLHINAQYPGRVHDQFIFNHSLVKTEMRRLYDQEIGPYFLLGDSGYGLQPWLMTPVLNAAPGSAELGTNNKDLPSPIKILAS